MPEADTEISQLRVDLEALNALQHLAGEMRIPGREHALAGRVLGWLEVRLQAAEKRMAEIAPAIDPNPTVELKTK